MDLSSTDQVWPPDYFRIRVVHSFEELITTPFIDGVNAVCWERSLVGDFSEVVRQLGVTDGITAVDEERLNALPLSASGRAAVAILIEDLIRLRAHGLAPNLDCIAAYARADSDDPVPTDVYSFHADSATVETDTYLCSYTEAASEGLRNEDALRFAELPEIRARLLEEFGGPDDDSFVEYLTEQCYDLHYAAKPGARTFSFGLGNLWRIAVSFPECAVPPCIHRAPTTLPGQSPRLLLIS